MNKHIGTILQILGWFVGGFLILVGVDYMIKRLTSMFDRAVGENPFGAVGGDTTDTAGWYTQWLLHRNGNADSKVFDPFGFIGERNLGNKTIERIFDPFGWWYK